MYLYINVHIYKKKKLSPCTSLSSQRSSLCTDTTSVAHTCPNTGAPVTQAYSSCWRGSATPTREGGNGVEGEDGGGGGGRLSSLGG